MWLLYILVLAIYQVVIPQQGGIYANYQVLASLWTWIPAFPLRQGFCGQVAGITESGARRKSG